MVTSGAIKPYLKEGIDYDTITCINEDIEKNLPDTPDNMYFSCTSLDCAVIWYKIPCLGGHARGNCPVHRHNHSCLENDTFTYEKIE